MNVVPPTSTRAAHRCPECGGPILDLLRDEMKEEIQAAGEWLRAQTLDRLGISIKRQKTIAAQAKHAFELGRDIGRAEARSRHLQSV